MHTVLHSSSSFLCFKMINEVKTVAHSSLTSVCVCHVTGLALESPTEFDAKLVYLDCNYFIAELIN